jgi:cold shock CspA family protein/ribosome-associated translation inhibitor RaiA
MILPLQISYRNFDASAEAENWVREEAAKLDQYYRRITSCRVLIEVPHAHRESGRTYHVRVDLGLPGTELVVKHEATLRASTGRGTDKRSVKALRREERTKDLHLAIEDAFASTRRRLQEYVRKRRREVKAKEPEPHGHIARTFPEKGFGFVATDDGREIYFHRNAVVGDAFEHLRVGTPVAFSEEPGEDGPHATIVKPASPSI